ncbi:hypothetical protein KSS87_005893 [Heliosperma pusillum]|nr:hypothetical protein KSS87_011316 [Heliosperma pusillum]KAH9614255.1 hypothetical protein KSS87_005893 [Heliosperma pusillum]
MASIALRHKSHHLNLKSHHTLFNFSRLYSSSSSNNDNDGNHSAKPSSFSSYFSQIKPKSDHQQQQHQQSSNRTNLDEIRKNLSEFRRLSSPIIPNPNLNSNFVKGGKLSFDKIRESLMNIREKKVDNNVKQQFSLNNYKQTLRINPSMGNTNSNGNTNTSRVIGGSLDNLPSVTFGKEIREKEKKSKSDEDDASKFELMKAYSHAELGKELKELRPDLSALSKNKKEKEGEEGWFSLSELQERLAKLKEIEEDRKSNTMGGLKLGDLRKSTDTIRQAKDVSKVQVYILVPGFMLSPSGAPQEHLIEKYFHPDNMSAAEKLKIELKKVRDEFKMSESDCGSTRVQIAQLTTEIHHLSSVLHKKTKEAFGLQKGKGMESRNGKRGKEWVTLSYGYVFAKLPTHPCTSARSLDPLAHEGSDRAVRRWAAGVIGEGQH